MCARGVVSEPWVRVAVAASVVVHNRPQVSIRAAVECWAHKILRLQLDVSPAPLAPLARRRRGR